MAEASTVVFDVEKFAVHDGPGIRTVVFMKGCPLKCLWCHNPESHSFEPEIFFNPDKCLQCGQCATACPNHCHVFQEGKHLFQRSRCLHCGRCAQLCATEALELVGHSMTVSQVLDEVLKDSVFYRHSNGGITLSGGEPLAHFEFTRQLLTASKAAGLHTCIETSGFAPWEHIQTLLPLVDLWLWDVKALPADHQRLTGVSADQILDNLRRLDEAGGKFILRCPLIPGVNASEEALRHIADLSNGLKNVCEINVEPYHPLGEGKNVRLGKPGAFHAEFVPKSTSDAWKVFISRHTKVTVK